MISTIIMSVVLYFLDYSLMPLIFRNDMIHITKLMQGIWVMSEVIIGTAAFFVVSYMFDIRETKDILRGGINKIKSIVKN